MILMKMLLLSIFCILMIVSGQDPVANIAQGRVVGIKVFMENSLEPIEIYFGIPYAAPPIGKLRFSPPERHNGWKRTFFAHRMAPSCPQVEIDSKDSSENCLYLNIWTSRRVDGQLQPVIIIFYSETWTGGSLNLPCQELASEGVVVVTVAYRLHLLSFFSLKSVIARGNLALLDQYMALLWVRENISAFGGDPTSVTLLGHSAGAESVLHHVVSPRTTGLYHRVIIMSPTNMWQGIYENRSVTAGEQAKVSKEIARAMGCVNFRDEDILQCMKDKPLEEITKLFANTSLEKYMQPTSDDFLPESIQYLPSTLEKAIRHPSGLNVPVDIMIGTTDLNSLKLRDSLFKSFLRKTYKQIYEFSMEKVLPNILQVISLKNSETYQTLQEAVRWEYWNRIQENIDNFSALESLGFMDSVVNWVIGSSYLAEKLAAEVPRVYVFRYSFPSMVDLYGNRLNFTGAVNGADIIALLGDAIIHQVARRPPTNDEKQISTFFRYYIMNFVKFGSPTTQEKWPRFTAKDRSIFEICDSEIYSYCRFKSVKKDISFWLQYLPELANSTLRNKEYSDMIVGYGDEYRLRGGVYAMCGISIILLLMLFTSGLLLRRRRFYRPSSVDSQIAY
ncbi:pyrethroid hydrolase Ces2a [Pieris rapae]|uniref:pyrethroid hydrolase Ces2a n=1 Tax=Pieris rapae TaxID=64459 RepID=UPI001E27D992|nr:pyrethroid hydrolase Ces2a [Pieris rapae]